MSKTYLWPMLVCLCIAPFASADEKQELMSLRNTVVGVLQQLVDAGVVTEEAARGIVEKAQADARAEIERLAADEGMDADSVRVTYVPEIVKDELRAEIREELRDEVADEVIARARADGWGVPGALPEWVSEVTWHADVRARSESVLFANDNVEGFYRDFQAINDAGGIGPAGQDAFLNVSEDVHQMKGRLRLGFDARLDERWSMGMRLATGNEGNPVTRNATFGEYDAPWDAFVDLAFVRFDSRHFLARAGRFQNPFMTTDLVFDDDITFEGVAMTGVLPFDAWGAEQRAFLTAGYFPLESVEFSSQDKYLLGAQLGTQLAFGERSVGAGVAWYDFANVTGERNAPGSELEDFTAPEFLRKGNTLFDIRNDTDPNTGLFALVADYELVDVTLFVDSGPVFSTAAGPVHMRLAGDYVKNIGYDEDDIFERTGLVVPERTDGYHVEVSVGMPEIEKFGQWRVATLYKHLERDAVLDAFTNDEFHRGGTDAEGWGVDVLFGLGRSTWTRLRYLTANEVDGPPLGIDLLQLDLNTKF